MARKRVGLGLADALVANRFLLWRIGAGCGLPMLATSISPRVIPPQHPLTPVDSTLLEIAGIASSRPCWLAFFPPQLQRRRFEGLAAAGS